MCQRPVAPLCSESEALASGNEAQPISWSSARLRGAETVGERLDDLVSQLEILIGTAIKVRSERVQKALIRAGAFDHPIPQHRLELRLGEDAGLIQMFEPGLDLFKSLCARSQGGVDARAPTTLTP
jgi:hypothetical protein